MPVLDVVNCLKKYILPCLLITILSFLLYFHVLNFSYTYLDDAPLVIDSHHQFTANPFSIFQIFIKNSIEDIAPEYYYRPALAASFMLNSLLSVKSLFGYYLVNVILHALMACSLFFLLKRLRYTSQIALLLSLFYVVHPLMVPTVAWLPGRNDTLLAVFGIFSFLAFVNFLEKTKWTDYFWHLSFLLLALFTKENAVCLIPVFFLFTHLVLRKKWFFRQENVLIAGWVFILTLWLVFRHMALVNPTPLTAAPNIDVLFRSLTMNSIVLLQYFGRIFFPFHLSVWPNIQDSSWMTGVIAVLLLTVMLFLSKEAKWDYVLFGIAWAILFLIPTLAWREAEACFSNHRVCMSMPGVMILLAEIDVIKHFNIKKKRHIFLISCVFLFYALIAFEHSYDYRNSAAFWNNARATAPHSWRDPDSLPVRPDH